MNYNYKFKNLDWSDHLVAYAEDKFEKLKKFELKPVSIHLTFSKERHNKYAEICIYGPGVDHKARSCSENYYESFDKSLSKVMSQMAKRKSRLQKHNKFHRSHRGKIQMLSPELEYNDVEFLKKAG